MVSSVFTFPLFRGVLFALRAAFEPRHNRAAPPPLPHDELGTNARHACREGAQGHNLKTLSDTFSVRLAKKRSPSIRTRPGHPQHGSLHTLHSLALHRVPTPDNGICHHFLFYSFVFTAWSPPNFYIYQLIT